MSGLILCRKHLKLSQVVSSSYQKSQELKLAVHLKELQKVEGLGKKKARLIRKVLDEKFDEEKGKILDDEDSIRQDLEAYEETEILGENTKEGDENE